jgi:hypothetical protein
MDDALPNKSFKGRLNGTLAAARFFLVSTMLHAILPLALSAAETVTVAPSTPSQAPRTGMPGSFSGRFSGTNRIAATRTMGGMEKAEKAVMAGLRWLKTHQNEDGSWADQNRPAMTGLAILCFLGHGELPNSPEFGATVKKGLDWLLAKGTEFHGNLSLRTGKEFGQPGVYEHAIATYAICEYYAMTQDHRFTELVKQAVTFIVEGQAQDGGWQYNYTQGSNSDTSVSGWQIQALKAAHLTGLGIAGVEESLDKAMLNLKRVQAKDGTFGYRVPGDRDYSLDGVGVLCIYFWKQDKDRTVRDGIEHMIRKTEKDRPVKYKHPTASLYSWYYNTQACLMFGGSAWAKWNQWYQVEIADAQSADGSWPKTGCTTNSHKENDDGIFGQCYRTTLCVLMLEVFYRYKPISR